MIQGNTPLPQRTLRPADACRLALGIVFLASALLKAASPGDLARQIAFYKVAQDTAACVLAVLVCAGEAGLGAFLVQRRSRIGLAIAGFVLTAFSLIVAYGWLFLGLRDCGCFGRYLTMTPAWALTKNAILLALVAGTWHQTCRTRETGDGDHPTKRAGATGVVMKDGVGMPPRNLRGSPSPFSLGGRAMRSFALPVLAAVTTAGLAIALGGLSPAPREPAGVFGDMHFDTMRGPLDLDRDTALVALLSETCPACAETVDYLNGLAANTDLPPVVAFVLGDSEAAERFRKKHDPHFAIAPLASDGFFSLVGTAPPRLLLLRAGRTLAYWDRPLPDESTILETLLKSD